MCRKNQLLGWSIIAFGLGVLLGARLGDCLFSTFLGLAAFLVGMRFLRKR